MRTKGAEARTDSWPFTRRWSAALPRCCAHLWVSATSKAMPFAKPLCH